MVPVAMRNERVERAQVAVIGERLHARLAAQGLDDDVDAGMRMENRARGGDPRVPDPGSSWSPRLSK